MAQTAEGAMQESTNILQRMRDLSVQAANGSNSNDDRASLQEEVTQLQAELTRISDTTEFGGQKLLDGTPGTNGAISFQVGANANETISFTLDDMDATQLGATDQTTFNAGSNLDNVAATLNTTAPANFGQLSLNGTNVGTDTNDASVLAADLNSIEGVNGVTASTGFSIDISNLLGTDELDLSINGNTITTDLTTANAAAVVSGLQTNLDSTFGAGATVSADGDVVSVMFSSGALAGTNLDLDIATTASDGTSAANGNAAFQALRADGTGEGNPVDILAAAASTDATVQGMVDVSSATVSASIATDGIQIGGTGITTYTDTPGTLQRTVNTVDITTAAGAQDAISVIDAAIGQIDEKRAELGAVQNRFESTISNLTNISENVSAARSRIRDVDFAKETAAMSQNQILQQAGTTILAQANQLPQAALSLLG
jgi:flagellin